MQKVDLGYYTLGCTLTINIVKVHPKDLLIFCFVTITTYMYIWTIQIKRDFIHKQ